MEVIPGLININPFAKVVTREHIIGSCPISTVILPDGTADNRGLGLLSTKSAVEHRMVTRTKGGKVINLGDQIRIITVNMIKKRRNYIRFMVCGLIDELM